MWPPRGISSERPRVHADTSLITTIASALGLALVLGFLAAKLKLPALVGYLVAGILLGPATPGFVAFGAGSLITGWLGDRWSRRHMMVIFFVGIGASMISVVIAP